MAGQKKHGMLAADAQAVLQPVQNHVHAGSDACPAITGLVLCQPEHRSLYMVRLECWRRPFILQGVFHSFRDPDGCMLNWGEVVGSYHLGP